MDAQLLLFRRQYLQLVESDFLAYPPKQLLRDPDVQAWLFRKLFDSSANARLPPERYQIRVLKPLLAKIEQSIEDPEEDEISDELMGHLSTLLATELPSEAAAVQQKTYVTFTCLPEASQIFDEGTEEPTVTLLERRHLISGSQTTGFRTWEAALHLGSYLLTDEGTAMIHGKNILELGAGTGFLSNLCAKSTGAKHVTATDGDEGVVEALRENLFLNDIDDEQKVLTSILRWGRGLKGTWVEEDCEAWPYDVVIGADIVIISGAVRNAETFETFRNACSRSNFDVQEIDFEPRPMREQMSLFYAKAVPLKILMITKP